LFADADAAGVNIEDVGIEHAPGRPVGVAELAVQPDGVDRLLAVLRARGWAVHVPAPAVERMR
jgi:prephenate dehydrogenase